MKQASNPANVENLIDDLIALQLAQVADLRQYAQATTTGEGTVQLERTPRRRELQRSELYHKFEEMAFRASSSIPAYVSFQGRSHGAARQDRRDDSEEFTGIN
jgi:hypothetical protein